MRPKTIPKQEALSEYLSKPKPLDTVELPLAAIQQLALYTDMSPLNIAIHLIANDNDIPIDTIKNMRKMTQELVKLTRNTQLDDNGDIKNDSN